MTSRNLVAFSLRYVAFGITAATMLLVTAHAQPKVGIVDLKKVFEAYYRTKQADSVLEANAREAKDVLDRWLEDHRKATEEYKKLIEGANDQAVSAEERDRRKKSAETKLGEIRDLEKNVSQYNKEAQTRIEEQKARLRDGIVEEIRKVVSDKSKAGNYSLVFDISGESVNNRNPFLLYTDGQNDLTADVIAELNKSAPADILGSANKNAPKEDKAPANLAPPKPPQKKDKK